MGAILQDVDSAMQQLQLFWDRLHFISPQRRPGYFDVHCEYGDAYNYTLRRRSHSCSLLTLCCLQDTPWQAMNRLCSLPTSPG